MKTMASIALLLAAAPLGQAAIVLSGNFNTGTPVPTLTITEDIVFSMSGSGNASLLVFDEWTVADSAGDSASSTMSQQFVHTRNGVVGNVNLFHVRDNYDGAPGAITGNDGFLLFDTISWGAGDTVVVKAGSYTFTAAPGFNPALAGKTFTGDVFFADANRIRTSGNVAVPEPSALLISALGWVALFRRRL